MARNADRETKACLGKYLEAKNLPLSLTVLWRRISQNSHCISRLGYQEIIEWE